MSCGIMSRIAVFQRHAPAALPRFKTQCLRNSRLGYFQNICAV